MTGPQHTPSARAAAPARGGQILSLNAVRGLAALAVVASHLHDVGLPGGPAHLGSVGVIVFFTLSGFLMGLLYLDQPATARALGGYAVARFSRIAPPYLVVVALAYLIYTQFDPHFPYAIDGHNVLRHLLFSGNVSVFWSIPPEVQFYAVFALIWWSFSRARQGHADALLAVVAVGVAVLFWRDRVAGTLLVSKLQFFVVGMLLGALHPRWRALPISRAALLVLQLGVLAVFGLYLVGRLHLPDDYWSDLAVALLGGLAVFAFAHDRTPLDRLLALRPLQWLGDWSFSVYLLHVPFIYGLAQAGLLGHGAWAWLGVSAAVAACALFSIGVEHPLCAFTKRRLNTLLRRLWPVPAPRPSVLASEGTAAAAPSSLYPQRLSRDRTPT